MLLIIIVLVLLFGLPTGSYYGYHHYGAIGAASPLAVVLVIALILYLAGAF